MFNETNEKGIDDHVIISRNNFETISNALEIAKAILEGGQTNLDNSIQGKHALPNSEGENDMSRIRERIYLSNGDVKWATGSSKQDVILQAAQMLYDAGMIGVKNEEKDSPTIKQFVDNTYRSTYIANLAPKTRDNYEQYLKNNIFPFFQGKKMHEITVKDIQDFYNWMAEAKKYGRKKNLNQKSIERISGFLGKIFRVAVDMKIISETPIKKSLLRNNGERAGHHKPLESADIDKVKQEIPTLKNEREKLLMCLLAYTGMRPEEILGLKWENVYLEAGYCEMVRTVTYEKNKKTVVRECGKSDNAIRTVVLPSAAIAILSKAKCKDGYVVFGKSSDCPCCYSTYKRAYTNVFMTLGIHKKYVPYDFRTTYGTELCEAGLTSKQVGDMMGHGDTRMVETVYAKPRHKGIMKNRTMLEQLNQKYAM